MPETKRLVLFSEFKKLYKLLTKDFKGCTALWLACHGGHLDTVQVLIRHNADVDAQDNRKVSPLMIAFRKGFVRVSFRVTQKVSNGLDSIISGKSCEAVSK